MDKELIRTLRSTIIGYCLGIVIVITVTFGLTFGITEYGTANYIIFPIFGLFFLLLVIYNFITTLKDLKKIYLESKELLEEIVPVEEFGIQEEITGVDG